MYEKFFNEPVILEIPTQVDDNGVLQYNSYNTKAIIIESFTEANEAGKICNRTVFLLKGETVPTVGSRIKFNSQTVTIGSVKTRRHLDGIVNSYYCVALS